MGYPKFRKIRTDEEYTWDFNILEPLAPIRTKAYRRYFEDLKDHPSGSIVGISSVGTRVFDFATSQLVFPLQLDLTVEQTESVRQFFVDGAFWFFPDEDMNVGYLVSYFPREFAPQPTPNGRFIVTGTLVQLGKQTINTDGAPGTDITVILPQYIQQSTLTSGISLWINDKEMINDVDLLDEVNNHAIYIFPEPESPGSDWTLLNNHFIRHETNYIDRYDRILFNWVRSIKQRYRLTFEAIGVDFIQKLARFVGQRYGRFYPVVNTSLADDTLTDFILPPNTAGLSFINVRIIDQELQVEHENRYYNTTITLEEI